MPEYDDEPDPRRDLDLEADLFQYHHSLADALDARIAIPFAAGSTLIGLLVAVFALKRDGLDGVCIIVLSIALAAYIVVTGATALAYWPGRMELNVDRIRDRSGKTSKNEAISTYRQHWQQMQARNYRKAFALRVAFVAIVIETICLVASLPLVASANGGRGETTPTPVSTSTPVATASPQAAPTGAEKRTPAPVSTSTPVATASPQAAPTGAEERTPG